MTGEKIQSVLADLLTKAKKRGADSADAVCVEARSLSVSARQGKREDVDHSETSDIGLRVFIGRRQAMVSSAFSEKLADLDQILDRAIAMAEAVPDDPYNRLADFEELGRFEGDLETFDDVVELVLPADVDRFDHCSLSF